jgi:hypothetical protein
MKMGTIASPWRDEAATVQAIRCLVEVWNCVHVDISSGTRVEARRFGNAQAGATARPNLGLRQSSGDGILCHNRPNLE